MRINITLAPLSTETKNICLTIYYNRERSSSKKRPTYICLVNVCLLSPALIQIKNVRVQNNFGMFDIGLGT